MSKINYEEMTNKELQTLIDDFELTVDAKTPNKPTKAELIATLNAFKVQQDIINGVEPEDVAIVEDDTEEVTSNESVPAVKTEKPVIAKPARELSRSERKALQRADLMRKERVVIHDMQDTQTKVPAMTVTWGGGLIGIHTDVVDLSSGKPQYVRRGALANMRNATFTRSVQEEEYGPVEQRTEYRFSIKELDGLNEDEIANLAAKQRLTHR
jgi:hypothetical protein